VPLIIAFPLGTAKRGLIKSMNPFEDTETLIKKTRTHGGGSKKPLEELYQLPTKFFEEYK